MSDSLAEFGRRCIDAYIEAVERGDEGTTPEDVERVREFRVSLAALKGI